MREYNITNRLSMTDQYPVTLTLYSFREVKDYIVKQRTAAAMWNMPYPIISVLSTPGR